MLSNHRKHRLAGVIVVVMALGVSIQQATAQVKAFQISGSGNILEDLPPAPGATAMHEATGNATHLGKYYGWGAVKIETIDFATLTGTFSSEMPFVFEAANGDLLVFQYGRTDPASGASPTAAQAGVVEFKDAGGGLVFAEWDAEFNPVPELCTGRFRHVVAGSFRMIAITDPFDPMFPIPAGLPYVWSSSGRGWLEFDKRRRR